MSRIEELIVALSTIIFSRVPHMSVALLVLPEFLMIAFGWLLKRKFGFSSEFFTSVEKLVYYVLFPALLFHSITRVPITLESAADLLAGTIAVATAGIAMSWLASPVLRPPALAMASIAQCGYRFNAYIALALSLSLGGPDGQAIMALIVGIAVPFVNVAAVYGLARQQGSGILSSLIRNPLFISTTLGLACNLAGLPIPAFISTLLAKLGAASIAMGIICVGASLLWQPSQTNFKLLSWMLIVKLLALPVCAWFIANWLELEPLKKQILVLFAALPPAPTAYVLAVRMGGDGKLVSLMISTGTLLAALTLPLWLLLLA